MSSTFLTSSRVNPPITSVAPSQIVTRVACHPAGDGVAAGYDNGEIAIGRISWRRLALALEATKSEITALSWSPDGGFLAAGDDDGHMHVIPVLLPPA